jgi:hypothetical protein
VVNNYVADYHIISVVEDCGQAMIKNNKTPLPERIERLIDEVCSHSITRPEACQQINLLLAEVIDEVLGQDETSEDEVENDLYYATRNGLRKEIKQHAKDMLGEK